MAGVSGLTLRRRLGSARGAELVEVALTMPVLLLMFAGIVEIGFLVQRYAVVTNAAREGARVAAVPGWSQTEVAERVNAYLTAAGLPVAGVITTATPVPVTTPTRTINAVQVTVAYPHPYMILGTVTALFVAEPQTSLTLTAAATMRAEIAAGL